MKQVDNRLNEEIAEVSVEKEAYYEDHANDFKTASMIREREKQVIIDFLKSNHLQDQLLQAITKLLDQETNNIYRKKNLIYKKTIWQNMIFIPRHNLLKYFGGYGIMGKLEII